MHLPVYCSTPDWFISGVNVFMSHLVRHVTAQGGDARLLLTGEYHRSGEGILPFPPGMPVENLGVRWFHSKLRQWRRLRRFLIQNSPCIYVPGFDWYCAYMCASLPKSVRLVGVLHSDEPVYYDWAEQVGAHFDRITTVSQAIADELICRRPDLADRVVPLHLGIEHANEWRPRRREPGDPLRLIYLGRVVQYQKRVFDLPYIVDALAAMGVPVSLTMVGAGNDSALWMQTARPWIERGLIRFERPVSNSQVGGLLREHDALLLCSEFEGLPLVALEAMSHGCVPVVTDIRSGVPEVIEDGVNGFRVPVAGIHQFAQKLAQLHHQPELLTAMSQRAHRTVIEKQFRIEDMCARYLRLFEEISAAPEEEAERIAPRRLSIPRSIQARWFDYLPGQVRRVGGAGLMWGRRLTSGLA